MGPRPPPDRGRVRAHGRSSRASAVTSTTSAATAASAAGRGCSPTSRPDGSSISWDINTEWELETDLERTSEVEVRFIAEGAERTRVELEHRHLDRHGDGWEEKMRDAVGSDEAGPPGCAASRRRFRRSGAREPSREPFDVVEQADEATPQRRGHAGGHRAADRRHPHRRRSSARALASRRRHRRERDHAAVMVERQVDRRGSGSPSASDARTRVISSVESQRPDNQPAAGRRRRCGRGVPSRTSSRALKPRKRVYPAWSLRSSNTSSIGAVERLVDVDPCHARGTSCPRRGRSGPRRRSPRPRPGRAGRSARRARPPSRGAGRRGRRPEARTRRRPSTGRLDLAGALLAVEAQARRAGTARAGGRRSPTRRRGSRRRAAVATPPTGRRTTGRQKNAAGSSSSER